MLSIESKINELLADERACAIADKYAPGLIKDPRAKMVGGMKLKDAANFVKNVLTDEVLAKIDEELKALD